MNGYITFIHTRKSVSMDQGQVNDGRWHYLEARWKKDNELELILDYGQALVRWCSLFDLVHPLFNSDHSSMWKQNRIVN